MTIGAQALVITINNPPTDFRVFAWNYESNEAVNSSRNSDNFDTLNFSIPDEFIQIDRDGKINLWKSLEAWRKGTPRGSAYPRTNPEDSVTRFPFYENYDPSKPSDLPNGEYYIGLTELLRKQKQYKDMSVVSEDGRAVNSTIPPVVGLVAKLKALEGKTVNCQGNSGKAEECLVCNCANEAGGEHHAGKVAVNRTVLTRLVRKGYPNSICGVIWFQAKGSAAFSWTLGGRLMSRKTVNKEETKACVKSSIEAVNSGPWEWDMFYSGGRPGWYNSFIKRGKKVEGGHTFMNSGAKRKSDAEARLRSQLQGAQSVE